jgi:hypothetical protein
LEQRIGCFIWTHKTYPLLQCTKFIYGSINEIGAHKHFNLVFLASLLMIWPLHASTEENTRSYECIPVAKVNNSTALLSKDRLPKLTTATAITAFRTSTSRIVLDQLALTPQT